MESKYPIRSTRTHRALTRQAHKEAENSSETHFNLLLNLFIYDRTISPIFILEFIKFSLGYHFRYGDNNYKLIMTLLLSFDISIFGEEASSYRYISIYLSVLQNFPTNIEDISISIFSKMTFTEQKVYDYKIYSLLINVPGINQINVWRNSFFVYFDTNIRHSFNVINFNFKDKCRPEHLHLFQLYDDVLNERVQPLFYKELKETRYEICVYEQQTRYCLVEHLIRDITGIIVSYINTKKEGVIRYFQHILPKTVRSYGQYGFLQDRDEFNRYVEIFRLL